jgi:outer membrane protein, heavy metal efflux system
MKRQQINASIQMSILLACMFVGCRTPNWWAYRSLRSVPCTSDSATSSHLQACSADDANKSPENATPTPAPPTSTPLRDEAAPKTPKDAATISAAPTIRLASHQQSSFIDTKPKVYVAAKQTEGPFKLPADLPGSETPPFNLQRKDSDGKPLDAAKLKENVLKLYSDFNSLTIEPNALPDSSNGVTRLEDLQQLARENHPGLRAAAASVESARGLMIQAGLPPNPNVGYEADTVRTLNTPGYHGAYLQQTFITAQKLGLAAQAAAVDYANAEVNQRKTWVTVQSNVRRSYFQVLGARRRLVLARALSELSENAYQAQIKLVVAGDAAPYEPLQLRVLTTQARASLIRAQQDSIAAWRTLAASVGLPNLAPSALDGRIDCPVPEIIYESALARMTAVHTDLQIAENLIGKNRTLVTLADRVPIPDLNVGFVLQRDYTFTPGTNTYNLMLGGAVPVWNRNQGNRISARAELVRSVQVVADTENHLTARLAPMFGTYEANRQIAKSFRTEALSDQVRAYRGIYQRYLTEPSGISFNDVIVGQQTVAGVLNQYLDVLQSQWQSTVDMGEMLQVDDLFQMGELSEVAEIPTI